MQDYGKEKFCLFYQLHFWYVSLGAWLSEQEEGSTSLNDRINRTRFGVNAGVLGERLLTWEPE